MFRKILISLILFTFSISFYSSFAIDMEVNCIGLPGCDVIDSAEPLNGDIDEELIFGFLGKTISEGVKFVAVFAVVALMLAGLNLVVGGGLSGEEEKVSNAKKWVGWAFVGVLLSVSAWGIINILNELQID